MKQSTKQKTALSIGLKFPRFSGHLDKPQVNRGGIGGDHEKGLDVLNLLNNFISAC